MTIQHRNILDPEIHEPKGVAAALSDSVYISNGTGSGSWSKLGVLSLSGIVSNGVSGQMVTVDGSGAFSIKWGTARGFIYFVNIPSPYTVTFPTTYTKVAPTTTGGGSPVEMTEATTSRITYTGASARKGIIDAEVCIAQASGADRDIRLAVYKNGSFVTESESIVTAETAHKRQITISVESSLSQNDYFEVYVKNDGASGDVVVYSFRMSITAF